MSDDLVAFLRARLDEDESAALGAKGDTSGRWQQDDGPPEDIELYAASGKLTMGQARHIARHDPARVLAEVAAKRAMVDLHELVWRDRPERILGESDDPFCGECFGEGYPCRTLRLLAAPYAGHADYRSEWAPGA